MILWLDDVRNPMDFGLRGEDFFWAHDSYEFVQYIRHNPMPDKISFDHDLGLESFDGYWCAKWLVNYCISNKIDLPEVVSHSSNPVGRQNIESVVNTYNKVYKKK